jgi:anti-sigma regulatory factor (Ser/Thr protein kinase)
MHVPCHPDSPSAVRDSVAQLEGLGWLLGDARLVASELVTNAVLHSGGTGEDLLEVRVSRNENGIVISVRDPGRSGGEATPWPDHLKSTGGLGLIVVDAIASRWGTEREDGYTVWAELTESPNVVSIGGQTLPEVG